MKKTATKNESHIIEATPAQPQANAQLAGAKGGESIQARRLFL
jgi:hypothetical protein